MEGRHHQTLVKGQVWITLLVITDLSVTEVFFSKVVEKIVLKQPIKHCQDNNLIPDY